MFSHQSIKRIDCILSKVEIAFFDALILIFTHKAYHGHQPYQWKWQKSDPFLPQKIPSEIVYVEWLAFDEMKV